MGNFPQRLSIIPFYGGKSRMASFIADRIDYKTTKVFVSAFGGACRVLLNKPHHAKEVYNDFSSGLCALMDVLSKPDTAHDLIWSLYHETKHTQEDFDRAKKLYDLFEIDFEVKYKNDLRKCLVKNTAMTMASVKNILEVEWLTECRNSINSAGRLDAIAEIAALDEPDELAECVKLTEGVTLDELAKIAEIDVKLEKLMKPRAVQESLASLREAQEQNPTFQTEYKGVLQNWVALRSQKEEYSLPYPRDMSKRSISDMELAIATYVVFTQSRDGRAQVWSKEKFSSEEQYRRHILKLYKCADRLRDVEIHKIDSMLFFEDYEISHLGDKPSNPKVWKDDAEVFLFCDPSYIDVKDEEKLLDGIDVENADSLADAIIKKYDGKKMPKNLGDIYARSFGYAEQEKFIRSVLDAKCKVLICNYDLILYNHYLTPERNWKREEFRTTTSVGGKKNNERLEVIWYNY